MLEIYRSHKEKLNYLFFGVLTTVVNIIVYYICFEIVAISNLISTVIAWILSVLFAYITNKLWVFASESKSFSETIQEFLRFIAVRGATGILDVAIMFIGVDVVGCKGMTIKVIANIIVVIINYIASKVVVFKS